MSEDNNDNVTPIWKRLEDALKLVETRQNPAFDMESIMSLLVHIEEISLRLSMSAKGEVRVDKAIAISRYIRSRLGMAQDLPTQKIKE